MTSPSYVPGRSLPTTLANYVANDALTCVDNCIFFPMSGGTLSTAGTFDSIFTTKFDVASLHVVIPNMTYTSSSPIVDVDGTASVTLSCALRVGGVQLPRITFRAGVVTTALDPGGFLEGKVGVYVPAGTTVFCRIYLSAGSVTMNKITDGVQQGGFTTTTDLTTLAAAAPPTTFSNMFSPVQIKGVPMTRPANGKVPSVVIQGDSISYGQGDGVAYNGMGYTPNGAATGVPGGGGHWARALATAGGIGWLNIAIPSDRAQYYVATAGSPRRQALVGAQRIAVNGYGRNDLANSRTPAQLQADLLTIAKLNARAGIISTFIQTITPTTTSTDGWGTTGAQTNGQSWETNRVTHNTWVRAGGPIDPTTLAPVAVGTAGALTFGNALHPIAGYFETSDAVETSRNSGIWKAAGRTITDAAITSGTRTPSSPSQAAFTNADKGKTMNIIGAGAAGAMLSGTITSVASATSATLGITTGSNASTTVSAAVAAIDAYTIDGIHPGNAGYIAMATACAPTKALLVDGGTQFSIFA